MAVLPTMTRERFNKHRQDTDVEVPQQLLTPQTRWMKVAQSDRVQIFEPLRIRRIIVADAMLYLILDGNIEISLIKTDDVVNDLAQRLNMPVEYFQK